MNTIDLILVIIGSLILFMILWTIIWKWVRYNDKTYIPKINLNEFATITNYSNQTLNDLTTTERSFKNEELYFYLKDVKISRAILERSYDSEYVSLPRFFGFRVNKSKRSSGNMVKWSEMDKGELSLTSKKLYLEGSNSIRNFTLRSIDKIKIVDNKSITLMLKSKVLYWKLSFFKREELKNFLNYFYTVVDNENKLKG